jgi:mono/diheme cytochrome c family protein
MGLVRSVADRPGLTGIKAVRAGPREDGGEGRRPMPTIRPILLAALLAAPATAQEADGAAAGGMLFQTYCASCHGTEARGDGPMQDVLSVDVPDLTGLAEDGVFPRFDVIAKIDGRDPIVSHGGAMPVWGDFFDSDAATFVRTETGQPVVTSEAIAALVAWLEGVQER